MQGLPQLRGHGTCIAKSGQRPSGGRFGTDDSSDAIPIFKADAHAEEAFLGVFSLVDF